MTSHHQNTFSDRKVSNTTMVSTSLNGPINKQKISNRINDKSSNITKKESNYINFINQNSKEFNNMNNEYNKYEKIYQDKKIELDMSYQELKQVKEIYMKKANDLEKTKEKYEILKQKNSNLKLMLMNLMKFKNITKDK
jgi:hypothetical protein